MSKKNEAKLKWEEPKLVDLLISKTREEWSGDQGLWCKPNCSCCDSSDSSDSSDKGSGKPKY